ncbi:hypothetical protein CRX57_03755 [Pseudomonas putida]|uniref:Uncharacterized protein n=1 Tax=Pseudomonas putida TaxID=303 RepID=A0A2C5V424_PSEPU|nr:hypothetical protein CRX57_03755 [Pseudomonas putida]
MGEGGDRHRRRHRTTLSNTEYPLWERACSRRRSIIQHFYRLTHRLREQARSHRGEGDPQRMKWILPLSSLPM